MQAVFQQLVQFSMHSYKGVRDLAVLTLESCMKQYPAYAMQLLPVPLAAMAKLPLPQLDLQETNNELSAEVLKKLRGAMRDAAGSGTPPSTPKGSGEPSAAGMANGLAPLHATAYHPPPPLLSCMLSSAPVFYSIPR